MGDEPHTSITTAQAPDGAGIGSEGGTQMGELKLQRSGEEDIGFDNVRRDPRHESRLLDPSYTCL
jgi:hypothetical protein